MSRMVRKKRTATRTTESGLKVTRERVMDTVYYDDSYPRTDVRYNFSGECFWGGGNVTIYVTQECSYARKDMSWSSGGVNKGYTEGQVAEALALIWDWVRKTLGIAERIKTKLHRELEIESVKRSLSEGEYVVVDEKGRVAYRQRWTTKATKHGKSKSKSAVLFDYRIRVAAKMIVYKRKTAADKLAAKVKGKVLTADAPTIQ